eukprot:4654545-Prymnesium_polylepis.1
MSVYRTNGSAYTLPRSAQCVRAVENERESYVAAISITVHVLHIRLRIRIGVSRPDSKALNNERYRKTAFLTLAVERDAAMAA